MAHTRKEKYFDQGGIRTYDLRILITVAPQTDREQAVGAKRVALRRDNLGIYLALTVTYPDYLDHSKISEPVRLKFSFQTPFS